VSGIGLNDGPDSRWYVDPTDPDLVYERVSSILDATDGQAATWLTPWSGKLSAKWAVDNIDEVQQKIRDDGPEAAISLIAAAGARLRELKADHGRYQHDVLEALLLDQPIPDIPPQIQGVDIDGEVVDQFWLDRVSDGLLAFLSDFQVKALLAEATVASVQHGYAGTLDMLGDFPTLRGLPWLTGGHDGARGLVDCKTGRYVKKRARAQMAGYRRADEVWLPLGQKILMPQVDFTAVLHLRPEYRRGYKLLVQGTTLVAEQPAWDWFLTNLTALRQERAQAQVKGQPLYPPGPDGLQPAPYLEDLYADGLGRCVKPLAAAGVETLDDLAAHTAESILRVRGIAEKSAKVLAELLAVHGREWSTRHADWIVA
jgi:hypothetical protein